TYAVGTVQSKLPIAHDLAKRGCDLKIITDSGESAQAIAEYGKRNGIAFKALIEVDTDGHRSGLAPDSPELVAIADILVQGGSALVGVLTHAGASYDLRDAAALRALAEQERAGCLRAAQLLRNAGHACPVVSVGSTPTALSAAALDGATEVRAGVYVFFDLVMHSVGVCALEQIALSVLATVIGHQKDKGWAIIDAGWMAMSRDRGTAGRQTDYGYGQVCDVRGNPIPGYIVSGANQEHGIISRAEARDERIAERFPLGALLRILPNHACATAAQFPEYYALSQEGSVEVWPRFYGW
ncbi:MAG: alanine racemase, partial [Syntrophorhabdaceae bacterium]|nr:alanine racemase [Syntrophorhabdaceae bacterium]